MGELLHVSSSPHIRSKVTTDYLMKMVIVALMPATVAGVCFFGWKALLLVCLSVATCVATEGIYETLMHKPLTIWDGSAVITGLLLGLNLPASAPWWIPVIGGVFAILIVKQLFGGLGQNIMNPALAARCFLLLSFTGQMTNFSADGGLVKLVDTVSGATPLAAVKAGEKVDLLSLFLGNTQGTIGETSALAILIGAVFLLILKVIDWRIPCTYIGSFAIFVILFGGHGADGYYLLEQLLTDAWCMVYGHRLCNDTDHQTRTAGIWRDPGMSDRTVSYLRSLRRGRILCHHLRQPADSGYRTADCTDSIWKRRGEA